MESDFAQFVHGKMRPAMGIPGRTGGMPDIEDLARIAEEHDACPYFLAQTASVDSDIIVCPYNYILDPSVRKNSRMNLRNRVVILDEAHNIEQVCRDAGSVEIAVTELSDQDLGLGHQKERVLHCFMDKIPLVLPLKMKFSKKSGLHRHHDPVGDEEQFFTRDAVRGICGFFKTLETYFLKQRDFFMNRQNNGQKLIEESERRYLPKNHRWTIQSWAPYKPFSIHGLLSENEGLNMGLEDQHPLNPLKVKVMLEAISKQLSSSRVGIFSVSWSCFSWRVVCGILRFFADVDADGLIRIPLFQKIVAPWRVRAFPEVYVYRRVGFGKPSAGIRSDGRGNSVWVGSSPSSSPSSSSPHSSPILVPDVPLRSGDGSQRNRRGGSGAPPLPATAMGIE